MWRHTSAAQNRYAVGPTTCHRAHRGGKRELLRLFVDKFWRAMRLYLGYTVRRSKLTSISSHFQKIRIFLLSRSPRFDGSGKPACEADAEFTKTTICSAEHSSDWRIADGFAGRELDKTRSV